MAEEIITSTNADTVTDHEYNASEIQVLKGLEAVRLLSTIEHTVSNICFYTWIISNVLSNVNRKR